MFNTPPHKMVLTRGAKQRMLETQSVREEPCGDVRTTGDREREVAHKSEPEYRGSMKSVKTAHSKSSKMSRKELEAQKKLIELEAAEARAKVELEIIDRKMAAKMAALEEQQCSDASSNRSALSKRVEDWLENDEKSVQGQAYENSDFEKLAQALKDVAVAATANTANAGMVSRLCTPKELPAYYGDPMEWLAFKQAYEESTDVCRFSAKENMWRLRNCLKGEARDSVTALLISAADPEAVMSTLELQFGQPDIILPRILRDIQKLHPVSPEYHKDIVSFSIRIKNYVAAVRCLSQEEYLRGVNITSLILSKLPPILLSKWSDYSYPIISVNSSVCRLEILSKFLSEEALKMSKTSVSLCVSNDYKNKQYSNSKSVMLVHNSVGNKSKCKYCNISVHSLFNCKKFSKSLRKDRWEYVKRHGLCYKCINGRHNRETCPAPACDVDGCNMSHHRLLHTTLPQQNVSTAQLSNVELQEQNVKSVNSCTLQEPNICNVNTYSSSQCLLKVVRVNIHGPNGIINCIAMLDDGSSVSLINSELSNRLGICGNKQILKVCGAWNNTALECNSAVVRMGISSADGREFEFTARSIDELNLPSQNLTSINFCKYKHLCQIKNKFATGICKPDILIGQDNYNLILPLKIIKGKQNEPYATLTPLGWCIHGFVSNLPSVPHSALLVCEDPTVLSATELTLRQIQEDVRRSFTLESMGISTKPRENVEDARAVAHLEQTSTLIDGRWYVGLPWKNVNSKMPESRPHAVNRLINVEKKMKNNSEFAVRYTERIQHLLDNDFARELSTNRPAPRTWYLPHFGVDNPNKKKLRLVFDAAAKSHGVCLNDYLLQGPDLLMSLFGIMLRFRENRIAVSADIKDQFLRIKITPEDQDALRFIWRDQVSKRIITFVMTSLIFGANCSPFIAQFIKNKNAIRFQCTMPEAVYAICKQHYADDYIDSVEDEETAIKLVNNISHIHSQGGFEIRNWTSNSTAVLNSLPKESLGASAVRFSLDQLDEGERTLGLIWHPKEDSLGFDVSFKRIATNIINGSKIPTKREMLRVIMSIFDVYGFLSPFTIKGKILLQDTWRSNIQWDDEIPNCIYIKWNEWLQILKRVDSIRLPRYFQNVNKLSENVLGAPNSECPLSAPARAPPCRPSPCARALPSAARSRSRDNETADTCTYVPGSYGNLQLHVFCDASTKAMCAVAYWRWMSNNNIRVAFIASKCRVAPLKPTSVPRLELQAALLAARLADTIGKEHNMKPKEKYFWCDSSTVLHWIRNDARCYKSFIAHRLGEIDELTNVNEWRYVPTKLNVADLATREACDFSVFNLDSEWFRGPNFLYSHETLWPADFLVPKVDKVDLEFVNTVHIVEEHLPAVPDPLRFSSWLRLVRSTSIVISFVYKKCMKLTGIIDGDMMSKAERLLITYAQSQSFSEDVHSLKNNNFVNKKSRLLTLSPFLDENGVLRAGGRIDAARNVPVDVKRPVILDGRHHVARLIVKHFHVRAAHGNHETVVNELKQKFWILHIRPTVKRVAIDCMFCRIRKAQPKPPRMGDLPEARLAHHQRPFTYCGLDLFGPIEVSVGRKREKRYGVLFTCLTVRAIHIEIVSYLTTDSLIMALRRMSARRGWPLHLYSDNGTNLRGADTEIRKSIQNLSLDTLQSTAINYGTTWTFIPPSSPHWGGAWERLIRTVKSSLKVILNERAPREEVLLTLMAEVEQIVNGRPLTHVSVEPGSEEALTPNHFLLGSSSNLPVLGEFDNSDLFLRKQWRIAQRLADMFWSRWVKEMLPQLIPRSKWTQEETPLKVGDFVVVVDPNSPRNLWLRGTVDSVIPGKDNRVRVVDIRTNAGMLRRSATRVARIPIG